MAIQNATDSRQPPPSLEASTTRSSSNPQLSKSKSHQLHQPHQTPAQLDEEEAARRRTRWRKRHANAHSECGRHSGDWLLDGFSVTEFVKWLFRGERRRRRGGDAVAGVENGGGGLVRKTDVPSCGDGAGGV